MEPYEKYINQVGAMGNIEGAILSGQYSFDVMRGLTLALRIVKNTTVEDVAPVIHSHWIEEEDCTVFSDRPWSMCAACGSYSPKLLYCAFCGAKMDEEVDDG